jgi:serine/threonine protein kinase
MDVFSLGVVLYIMITGNWPFQKSGDNFHLAFLKDPNHSFAERELEIETESISLMCSMMAIDPDERPSIQQVKEHKWMQLPRACQEEVKDYYY